MKEQGEWLSTLSTVQERTDNLFTSIGARKICVEMYRVRDFMCNP